VESLCCARGEKVLFEALDFELFQGECLRVFGANGVGKTSLLRLLCGLGRAESGRVRWRGEPIDALAEGYRGHLLYIGHQSASKDALTVQENLEAFCGTHEPAARPRIGAALAAVAIEELAHRPVATLSAGQRRRASLARLALSSAPLWLLDEPFAALDSAGEAIVRGLLAGQLERDGCVVFTAHGAGGPPAGARCLDLSAYQPAGAPA